jgi:hypothetical protein
MSAPGRAWWLPRRQARNPGSPGRPALPPFDPASQVLATVGPPAQTCDLGRYPVLAWHQNLLRRLQLGRVGWLRS